MSTRPSGCISAQQPFLGIGDRKMPYIIGVAGSVAVGKSTTARVLQALLARWSPRPKVDLVTTDGFLFPNAVLERAGPDAEEGLSGELRPADAAALSLSDIKAGRRPVRAPVYSHLTYDIVPNEWIEVDRPDILIVEGINVLQTGAAAARRQGDARSSRTSSISRSISMPTRRCCANWYVGRFLALRDTAFPDPRSYFHRYAPLSDEEATATATRDLGAHQPRQSRREHPADPAARRR